MGIGGSHALECEIGVGDSESEYGSLREIRLDFTDGGV